MRYEYDNWRRADWLASVWSRSPCPALAHPFHARVIIQHVPSSSSHVAMLAFSTIAAYTFTEKSQYCRVYMYTTLRNMLMLAFSSNMYTSLRGGFSWEYTYGAVTAVRTFFFLWYAPPRCATWLIYSHTVSGDAPACRFLCWLYHWYALLCRLE